MCAFLILICHVGNIIDHTIKNIDQQDVPVGTTSNVSCAIHTSATSEKKVMVINAEKLKQNTKIILIEQCSPEKHTIPHGKRLLIINIMEMFR